MPELRWIFLVDFAVLLHGTLDVFLGISGIGGVDVELLEEAPFEPFRLRNLKRVRLGVLDNSVEDSPGVIELSDLDQSLCVETPDRSFPMRSGP